MERLGDEEQRTFLFGFRIQKVKVLKYNRISYVDDLISLESVGNTNWGHVCLLGKIEVKVTTGNFISLAEFDSLYSVIGG